MNSLTDYVLLLLVFAGLFALGVVLHKKATAKVHEALAAIHKDVAKVERKVDSALAVILKKK